MILSFMLVPSGQDDGNMIIHGDTPEALAFIRRIREPLEKNGIGIGAF